MIEPGRRPRSTFRTIAPTRACRHVVARVDVPEHLDEPEPQRDVVGRARMLRVRRAKEPRLPADLRVDLVLRPHQLEPDEPVRQARQVRVRPRVVADAAEPRLRVRGMRPVREPVADVEERRVRAVAPQDREQLRRVRARAVVEGERDRVAVAAAARDDLPPREHLLQRAVLRPRRREARPPEAGRRPLRRRHRRRDEGDDEQGGEQRRLITYGA